MSSMNDDFGLACPNCEQRDAVCIQMTCMTHVTPNGSEPYGDHDWDGTSYCCCEMCGQEGTVADFAAKHPTQGGDDDHDD
jgi:hypothetical protein